MSCIGEIHSILTSFYNPKSGRMEHKGRPGLVVANADEHDFVVIPISTVPHRENLDPMYDIEIDPAAYPCTGLKQTSYARTHKQTIINDAQIGDACGDLRASYPDLYMEILTKRDAFNSLINNMALA